MDVIDVYLRIFGETSSGISRYVSAEIVEDLLLLKVANVRISKYQTSLKKFAKTPVCDASDLASFMARDLYKC